MTFQSEQLAKAKAFLVPPPSSINDAPRKRYGLNSPDAEVVDCATDSDVLGVVAVADAGTDPMVVVSKDVRKSSH